MGKAKKRTKDSHSLLTELLVSVLLLFMLSLLMITGISMRGSGLLAEELYRKNLEDSSRLLEDTIRTNLAELYSNAYIFGTDNTLKSYKQSFDVFSDDPLSYVKLNNYIVEQLSQLEALMNDIINSSVYIFRDNYFYTYTKILRKDADISPLLDGGTDTVRNGISRTLRVMPNPVFVESSEVIPMVFDYTDSYLICFISVEKLATLIDSYYSSFFDDVRISYADGTLIRPGNLEIDYMEAEKAGDDSVRMDGKEYVLLSTAFPLFGWNIDLAKDNSSVSARLKEYNIYLTIVTVLLLILTYVTILKTYSRFRRPFDRLSALMRENSDNICYEHFDYPGNNEIGQLGRLYNEMIDEIESLILQLEDKISQLEEEKRMKEWEQEQKRLAEIKALQAQINPHFLYNALNSIVWIAEDKGDSEVKEITLRLANYYRTGLSKGSDTIRLEEEIKHAENYLWIQCQRYDQIEFSIDARSDILCAIVPKLILQPLIENAIYHGIKPVGGQGKITVDANEIDGHIILEVSNTGEKIGKEKLAELNRNLSDGVIDSSTGYGIYNVNSRIKLTYGTEWGLHLESNDEITKATLTLPLVKEERK